MRRYVCRASGSVLRGLVVARCPLWPIGAKGPMPPPGRVVAAGGRKRGPRNAVVLYEGRLVVTPMRTLRRIDA